MCTVIVDVIRELSMACKVSNRKHRIKSIDTTTVAGPASLSATFEIRPVGSPETPEIDDDRRAKTSAVRKLVTRSRAWSRCAG